MCNGDVLCTGKQEYGTAEMVYVQVNKSVYR